MKNIMDGANTCVICGRVIPEGSQICSMCEKGEIKKEKELISEDIPMPTDMDMPREEIVPCYLCDNARLNDELEDYNDFHSSTIGSFSHDCRIMLSSGWGKPLRIEIARWNDDVQEWQDIGIYYPKFCPECGREIREYEK